ncbi:hypothetical protein [Sulfuricurvum sp.]|uniref:hypothetical protein n=1 Tax=Sulfuricurvum sp. TaxID=2025608 RepID=UPI00272D4236|nr:hypothetical protein [Sulfuricurvum sp.]
MRRSGIVLLMTLMLITLLMGIVALVLAQSGRLSRLGGTVYFQSTSQSIVNDLQQHLPILLLGVTGAEQLDLALRLPLQIETRKRDFILKMKLSSPYTSLNVNTLLDKNGTIKTPNVAVFMRIFSHYPIESPDIFLNLLLDTIDIDTAERGVDTEISLTRPNAKNGSIANEREFNRIIERYLHLTQDRAVLSIPWGRYIGFDGDKMDFNALNAETLSLILTKSSPEKIRSLTRFRTKAFSTKEEVIAAEPALGSVFDTYFFIYAPGISYTLLCDAVITENTHVEHITFQYNLLEKRVHHVEFL